MNNLFDKLSLESDLTYVWVYKYLYTSWILVQNLGSKLNWSLESAQPPLNPAQIEQKVCLHLKWPIRFLQSFPFRPISVHYGTKSLQSIFVSMCCLSKFVLPMDIYIIIWICSNVAWNNKSKVKGKLGLKMKNDNNGWNSLNLKKVRGIFMDDNIQ